MADSEKQVDESSVASNQREGNSPTGNSEDLENQNVSPSREQEAKEDWSVNWSGPDDPAYAKNFKTGRKWLITFTIAFCSVCVTTNSTLYTFTYNQIEPEFGISREVATLGLTFFVVGLAIGPMFLAPLSEFYGRRIIYISAFTMVAIWIIPCAVAQNIETIIVTRVFDGIACSVFLSVAGGSIGDMFAKQDLSWPMMVYSGSPFIGPTLGPIMGGFINQYADWRWSFWVLLIWTCVLLGAIVLLIPETYEPVLLRWKAQKLRKETGEQRWFAPIEVHDKSVAGTVLLSCKRPFQLLFWEPMVLNLCTLSAILLGILYLFFGAFDVIFVTNYDFELWQVGLTFIGLMVGMVLAIVTDPIWQWNYRRLVRNYEKETGQPGKTEPEFRLPPTIFGAQAVWIGMFLFGWTTLKYIHWIAPIIFSSLVGFGIVTTYSGIFTFLVESYPLYAASALAANSIARSVFAAVFPLFGVQMYQNLGFQWASSLLGFLLLVMAPFPYIFFRYGKKIRKKSRYANEST